MSHNIYELFTAKWADKLDKPFLTVPGQAAVSYGEVEKLSAAMATVLRACGTQTNDRVVVQVDKSIAAVALYLACLRGGYVYIPLNTAYTPEEVGYFLGDSTPTVLVFTSERSGKLQPVADLADVKSTFTLNADGSGTLIEQAALVTQPDDIVAREPDDLACILYTSGTTGNSKGAMLSHNAIAMNAKALWAIWRFRPGDVLLHALPIFHVHGLFVALHCAILNTSEVIFLDRFSVAEVKAYLPHSTVMMGIPTFYSRLLEDPDFGTKDCQTVRMFTSGSAPLNENTFKAFTERTGHSICERYGMTECGIITSNPPEGRRVAGTVGYALPEMQLRIADQDDQPLPAGEIGQVQVRGPHLFAGYWQLPHKTVEVLAADGYFRTGDLGYSESDGRLTLVGRANDMIITGGYNVYPKEVELLLDQLPGINESAVVGLPHSDYGEAVTAFLTVTDTVDESTVLAALEDKLAVYKRPKRVVQLENLPRNAMGKVQKVKLQNMFGALYMATEGSTN